MLLLLVGTLLLLLLLLELAVLPNQVFVLVLQGGILYPFAVQADRQLLVLFHKLRYLQVQLPVPVCQLPVLLILPFNGGSEPGQLLPDMGGLPELMLPRLVGSH